MRQDVWPAGGDMAGNRQSDAAPPLADDIRAILRESAALAVDPDSVSDSDDLYAAGLTSHGCVSLMLALEERFDVEFPERLLHRRTFESISAIGSAVRSIFDEAGRNPT
ncbi:acyl carrier protein [Azospirillum thermophilum]|uniref:Acyl carrier protein n=2 Tax=Azospirillum thermophilum TaxID=2202148 RepID=A0A2S2CMY7_9PROT|nr:acyl carrier protein [Azospirillum thermophilum]